jgi:hypothetical protein
MNALVSSFLYGSTDFDAGNHLADHQRGGEPHLPESLATIRHLPPGALGPPLHQQQVKKNYKS